MQKLSACRKRGSSIHFFSSTTMRCIIAICAAGPPKLTQPILSHVRKASPKVGEARGSDCARVVIGLTPPLWEGYGVLWRQGATGSSRHPGRHDQRKTCGQEQDQDHFAESGVVELSVQFQPAPDADDQRGQGE